MDEIDIHAKLAQIETAPHFSEIFDESLYEDISVAACVGKRVSLGGASPVNSKNRHCTASMPALTPASRQTRMRSGSWAI